jgi:pimeloyl-ACP methyl ester carboxylesterase
MPGAETGWLRRRLERAGFLPMLFRYPTLRATLAENAAMLAELAERIGGERLHFVGYSLGGVVALTMLANAPARRPGRIVCLGSPLQGSRTALRLARTPLGRKLVGKSMLELNRQGGIGHRTFRDPVPEIGVIAGTRSFGVGRLIGGLSVPNDGTVTVDETELASATARITLPVTHTQLLFDAVVARQTIHFLRHGRFTD